MSHEIPVHCPVCGVRLAVVSVADGERAGRIRQWCHRCRVWATAVDEDTRCGGPVPWAGEVRE